MPAGRSGGACPRRTPTSSSPCSARSSACSAPSSCSALVGLLGYAGFRIASRSDDPFSRYAAGGVTTWFVVQALFNLAVVLRLLPIAGVPLPLVSYGGSALIGNLLAVGVLLELRPPRARRPATCSRPAAPATGRA